MTERKPAGVSWRSFVERQIDEARERGELDDLEGQGRPIPELDRPHDELWWVKAKLRRERVDHLPPTLAIHREREQALARSAEARTEAEAAELIEAVNRRIRYLNSHGAAGPPSTAMPIDVDAALERWRRAHPPAAANHEPEAVPESGRPRRLPGRRRRRGPPAR